MGSFFFFLFFPRQSNFLPITRFSEIAIIIPATRFAIEFERYSMEYFLRRFNDFSFKFLPRFSSNYSPNAFSSNQFTPISLIIWLLPDSTCFKGIRNISFHPATGKYNLMEISRRGSWLQLFVFSRSGSWLRPFVLFSSVVIFPSRSYAFFTREYVLFKRFFKCEIVESCFEKIWEYVL